MVRKISSGFLLAAAALLSTWGCNKNDNAGWLEEPAFENPMTLTATPDDTELDEAHFDEVAVTFKWTAGNPRGEGTSLKYLFKMDLSGNEFTTAIPTEDIPDGVFSRSYTVQELNDMILEHWKAPGGETVRITGRIIAQVEGGAQFRKPEIAETEITVKSFPIGSQPLYLSGSAVPGDGKPAMNEMTIRKEYLWQGELEPGDFTVALAPDEEYPCYYPAGPSALGERLGAGEGDQKFSVTHTGRHSLYIDRTAMTYAFGYAPHEAVYMVGDATPTPDGGWKIDEAVQLDWDRKTPSTYTWTGELKTGEIKFPVSRDLGWDTDFYKPAVNGTEINGAGADEISMEIGQTLEEDKKWKIAKAGKYHIVLNPGMMSIVFTKLD